MLINDPLLQALMAGNRAPAQGQPLQPQGGNQISSVVQAALADQMRGQQIKAQIMQALGFGQNPMPMGAIPHGAGVTVMDGQAYTRPGGMPTQVTDLLSNLMGAGQGGAHSRGSMGSLQSLGVNLTQQMERPGPVLEQVADPAQNEQAILAYLQRLLGGR